MRHLPLQASSAPRGLTTDLLLQMVGGRHRYAADQYGGGRHDSHAMASARLWYSANVGSAGLTMMFMGTEWAQPGKHVLAVSGAASSLGQCCVGCVARQGR